MFEEITEISNSKDLAHFKVIWICVGLGISILLLVFQSFIYFGIKKFKIKISEEIELSLLPKEHD